MMKKLNVSLSALAVVLGIGAAVAGNAKPHFANKRWGRLASTGTYVDITGKSQGIDYSCTTASSTCTAEFPSDVDPNNQAGDAHPGTAAPQNVVNGLFSQ